MESTDHRTRVSQLADDLGWLETHTRGQADLDPHSAGLRVAAGLVRNVIGPYLDRQPPQPLHVAVVGGAGTGKSTVANFLTGRVIAEANPQAGYTRHPTAYVARSAGDELAWSSHLGFLGALRKLTEAAPANLDEDVYQVRRVADADGGLLRDFVVWDCPDMTTWAATSYIPRLLEVASLADLLVYVASDERYNDAVPTDFLKLFVRTGKPVICVLTKMREADAPALANHFRREVVDKLPATANGARPIVPVFTIPYLKPDQLADPVGGAAKYRIPLMNQVGALSNPAKAARERTVSHALGFLARESESLLSVAKNDLLALEAWQAMVASGRDEFEQRYRREFLTGEPFRRFDDTRRELLQMLELPSAGQALSGTLWVLRAPYRLLRGLFTQMLVRPEGVNLPEHTVLKGAMDGWLSQLRSESLQRVEQHPIWRHVAEGFNGKLGRQADDEFEGRYREFQLSVSNEVEGTRQSITESLRKNNGLLFMLRLGKLAIDLTAIVIALSICGLSLWLLLAIPLLVSLGHQLVEVFVGSYVESKREQVRRQQEKLVAQHVAAPMADWLGKWPTSGGSSFERLQRALRRIPEATAALAEMSRQRMQEN